MHHCSWFELYSVEQLKSLRQDVSRTQQPNKINTSSPIEVGYNCNACPPSQRVSVGRRLQGYTRQCQRYGLDISLYPSMLLGLDCYAIQNMSLSYKCVHRESRDVSHKCFYPCFGKFFYAAAGAPKPACRPTHGCHVASWIGEENEDEKKHGIKPKSRRGGRRASYKGTRVGLHLQCSNHD